MRYTSREARSEIFLYYLRERPGDAPSTTFNEGPRESRDHESTKSGPVKQILVLNKYRGPLQPSCLGNNKNIAYPLLALSVSFSIERAPK